MWIVSASWRWASHVSYCSWFEPSYKPSSASGLSVRIVIINMLSILREEVTELLRILKNKFAFVITNVFYANRHFASRQNIFNDLCPFYCHYRLWVFLCFC